MEKQGIGKVLAALMLVCKYLKSFIAVLSPRSLINWCRTILPIMPITYREKFLWVLHKTRARVFNCRIVFVVLIAIVLLPLISGCTASVPRVPAEEARPAAFWQRPITQLDLFFTLIAWTIGLVLMMAAKRFLSAFARRKRKLQPAIGPTMIYSCLHLDQHESLRAKKTILDRAIKKPLSDGLQLENLVSACDLIATPDQISDGYAHQVAKEIIQHLDRRYPNLRGRFVGISDDDHLRPMRDGLISGALALGDVDNVHHFIIE
jgi:hypothetical protein